MSELCTFDVALGAARAAVAAERAGSTILPPRLDVHQTHGFLRAMPAALDGVMGMKVMTLVKGVGTRYLVLVYAQDTGELLALLDADEITRWRTAATTALAGAMLAPEGTKTLGLVGSGFEAEGHLRTFAKLWPLETVRVYSPSVERRESFAARMTADLDIEVRPVTSCRHAVDAPVSILATKATEPVIDGDAIPRGSVVLSIGSTRPDLRELDTKTLRRATIVLADDANQVQAESGDIIAGLADGAIDATQVVSMATMTSLPGVSDGRDLLTFKSVGTAVHDLALAVALIDAARTTGRGRELGELSRLKPFAAVKGQP